VDTILWPALAKLHPDYPDVVVEISINTGFVDIVAERFDAGIRLDERAGPLTSPTITYIIEAGGDSCFARCSVTVCEWARPRSGENERQPRPRLLRGTRGKVSSR
jgi:DNA-binding transcriptional LysR family regulator